MFGVMGRPREELTVVAGVLGNAAETHIAPSNYGGHTCTVTPPGLSKWIGVVAYCTQVGLDPARALAIGDGPNDIELLTAAAVAVVPSDACADALGVGRSRRRLAARRRLGPDSRPGLTAGHRPGAPSEPILPACAFWQDEHREVREHR